MDELDRAGRACAHRVAGELGKLPQVLAVALAGSAAAGASDAHSDVDLYVYAVSEVPVDLRRSLAGPGAEIDNRFWEPGDEWPDEATGVALDVMYRSPLWIEDQLDRVLLRHEASIGYSTCFWYNVLHSEALFDPRGWYGRLQERARAPYPAALARAIIEKNYPLLRVNRSSYPNQIRSALRRGDLVSRNHRVAALLASFFDVWFALERCPHPGEKRLLHWLPQDWADLVRAVLEAGPRDLLARIDALLERLEQRLAEEASPGPPEDHIPPL